MWPSAHSSLFSLVGNQLLYAVSGMTGNGYVLSLGVVDSLGGAFNRSITINEGKHQSQRTYDLLVFGSQLLACRCSRAQHLQHIFCAAVGKICSHWHI